MSVAGKRSHCHVMRSARGSGALALNREGQRMTTGYFAGLLALAYRETTDGRRVTPRRTLAGTAGRSSPTMPGQASSAVTSERTSP